MPTERLTYNIPSDGFNNGTNADLILTYDAVANPDGSFNVTNASGTYQVLLPDGTTRTDNVTGVGAPNDATLGGDNKLFIGTQPYVTADGLNFTIDNASDSDDGAGLINFYSDAGTSPPSYFEANQNGLGASSVTESPACFLPGTLIRTVDGDVAVEDLAVGDVLRTADGETRPVKWVGRQTVVSRFADPLRAYPIRIQAGAIAENVPARDLSLSPDHALLIDGVLVQAGALVNGTTVTRVMNPEARFTYYHVETEDHAVILAEGTPAETFVSNVTRRTFDNYAEYEALFGDRADFEGMADRDEPRAMSARQVPPGIKARLAARAVWLRPGEAVAA